MVTGRPAASKVAARAAVAHGGEDAEGEERGGAVPEDHQLTRSSNPRTARAEEAGVDGKVTGGAAARAEGRRRFRPAAGLPARAGCPGR